MDIVMLCDYRLVKKLRNWGEECFLQLHMSLSDLTDIKVNKGKNNQA